MNPVGRIRRNTQLTSTERIRRILHLLVFFGVLFGLVGTTTAWADDDDEGSSVLTITSASWDAGDRRLTVRGRKDRRATVTVVNAFNPAQVIGSDNDDEDRDWRVRDRSPSPVPCRCARPPRTVRRSSAT